MDTKKRRRTVLGGGRFIIALTQGALKIAKSTVGHDTIKLAQGIAIAVAYVDTG
jgi:hypothetical protein